MERIGPRNTCRLNSDCRSLVFQLIIHVSMSAVVLCSFLPALSGTKMLSDVDLRVLLKILTKYEQEQNKESQHTKAHAGSLCYDAPRDVGVQEKPTLRKTTTLQSQRQHNKCRFIALTYMQLVEI